MRLCRNTLESGIFAFVAAKTIDAMHHRYLIEHAGDKLRDTVKGKDGVVRPKHSLRADFHYIQEEKVRSIVLIENVTFVRSWYGC